METASLADENSPSEAESQHEQPNSQTESVARQPRYLCDRCGFEMFEANCKIVCPNCGSRYECSDLSIYFD